MDPHPEADDFQNLASSSLSTDTYVIQFSWRSVQWFLHKVANRQTDRQTENAGHYISSLAEVTTESTSTLVVADSYSYQRSQLVSVSRDAVHLEDSSMTQFVNLGFCLEIFCPWPRWPRTRCLQVPCTRHGVKGSMLPRKMTRPWTVGFCSNLMCCFNTHTRSPRNSWNPRILKSKMADSPQIFNL